MTIKEGNGVGPTRIALVGVGGTGCALLPLLCALPVDAITVIDGDTVEARNLDRQLLFSTMDVGRPKVEAAMGGSRLRAGLKMETEFRFVDAENARDLLKGSAVVADCTDDLAARALIERTCRELGIPLVSGAVYDHQIQVVTCSGEQHLRERSGFFQGRASEEQLGCDMQRVPAAVTTITASLMALRIADILRGGSGLAGVMDLVDSERGRWMRIMGPEAGEFMDTPINPVYHG
ncbi:MAG TPA: ThiF family adenylyltransferase [Flavobacteriales bacterium]|nr:ThiF family adenylyltransferase [Flavobacteriales bacterium]